MSFFDDEPTRASPRAGRPAPRPRPRADSGARRPVPRAGGGGGRTPDEQTLLVRRLVAGGGGLLVIILLVVFVNGCVNSRTERALKDYTRNVATVVGASQSDVSTPLFQLLNGGADNPGDLQASVSQYRVAAEQQVKQARGFSVPSQMENAQNALLLTLNLRATAIAKIADRIPAAQAKGRDNAQNVEQAIRRIAGQMRAFDASDVIYSQRVVPYVLRALKDAGVDGPALPSGQFLPDLRWLQVNAIAEVLGSIRADGGTGANPQPPKGLHGHGLVSVAVGGTTLNPSPAVNKVSAAGKFTVKIANQGDFDEQDVKVRVSIKAGTAKAITATATTAKTTSKTEATVEVPLDTPPPIGAAAVITVEVVKVPGEMNVANNKMTYRALFQR